MDYEEKMVLIVFGMALLLMDACFLLLCSEKEILGWQAVEAHT